MQTNINVLLSTLPGMDLPKTLCLPLSRQTSAYELLALVASLLPLGDLSRICLTTTSNRSIQPRKDVLLADLAATSHGHRFNDAILPLRMSSGLVGGKGGFGSQLRAAGGRMSARKKRQNAELATGSARNLDGRRLRTITEAKNLATYLATKPDMDRKQKEERRKRWEQVIELAEQREADVKAGKGADGHRKGLSEEWIEEKEEVGENVKNAVKLAMAADLDLDEKKANQSDQSSSDSVDEESDDEEQMELEESDMAKLTKEAEAGDADAIWVLKHKLKILSSLLPRQRPQRPKFAGFDDDDDDDTSSSEEDEIIEGVVTAQQAESKLKGIPTS